MASTKSRTAKVAVVDTEEEVEDTEAPSPESTDTVPEAELAPDKTEVATPKKAAASGNPLLGQEQKKGTPNNTWTLWYGGLKFDCVEGVARSFPEEVFFYLKKSGNLVNPEW